MRNRIRAKRVIQTTGCMVGVLAWAGMALAAPLIGPVDTSGYLGYYYRSLVEEEGREDLSHQLSGTLNVYNYFVGPWLATSRLSLSFTEDSSSSKGGSVDAETTSQILTGDWGLDVLPQSRTPFNLRLQATDSRVDSEGTGATPITYIGNDYSTLYLGLKQSYLTANGGRFQASYDYRNWDSENGGEYNDDIYRLEADLRGPRQHFIGRYSYQQNEQVDVERENNSQILDLSHFYYPVRHFRIDSKVSRYEYERSFLDPTASDTRMSELMISQLSSNAFWRPENQPLTVNAGVRLYALEGAQDSLSGNDLSQLVMNAGLFYSANQNIRFDASVMSLYGESGGVTEDVHQQQVGALYQSDWRELAGFMYQAYLDGDLRHRIDVDDNIYHWAVAAGHGLGRTWWPGERTSMTSFRLNLNQSLTYYGSRGNVIESSSGVKLDHAATFAFNQHAWGGDTLVQLIVSDTRDFVATDYPDAYEDAESEQQLVNFQVNRDQDLGRRSSITGNITVQYVRQRGETDTGTGIRSISEIETTTSTGRVTYSHHQVFGIPRLQFASDYMVSRITTEGAIDRQDWENRLSYYVGKLDTSLSYRLTEADSHNYDLLYFRVMRRF